MTAGNGNRRVMVVTGASAGVGRAIARAFARRGAVIGLLARDRDRLERTAREVRELGGEAVVLPADVADPAAVETAAGRMEHEAGPIDVWINNAMATILAPLHAITPDVFRRVTDVTYLGCVHGTMAALRRMRPRNRGVIIQVGSALAYRGIPLQSAYCGAKHAMNGFTESLRTELRHDGVNIHVGMLQLPAMNTPQFDWCRTRLDRQPQPVPPIFQPEYAAEAVVRMVDRRQREVLLGMPTLKTVWGNKLMPEVVEWYLARNGYSGQQTDDPVAADRPDNLFQPVAGDFEAHGRFDAVADAQDKERIMDIIRIILAILLPPLGVFLQVGLGTHFWLNVLLTLLGYIPGIIHAIYVISTR